MQTEAITWLDRVLPTNCAGCGRTGSLACEGCAGDLDGPAALAWPRPAPPGLPPPWAVAAYAGSVRSLLLAYKEHGASGLRRVLAGALTEATGSAIRAAVREAERGSPASTGRRVVLVPMPSTRRAVRRRGDDVVAALARQVATALRRSGLDVTVVPALSHARRVADSAGLDAAARARNLSGALQVRPGVVASLVGRPVVLLDDLITTGATLAEAARALRAVEVDVVAGATVAATQRRAGTATQRAPARRPHGAPVTSGWLCREGPSGLRSARSDERR